MHCFRRIKKSSHVRIECIDLLGRVRSALLDDHRSGGAHSIDFDAAQLAPGSHLIRMYTEGVVLTRAVEVIR